MIQEPVYSTLRRTEFAELVDLFVGELPLRMSVIEQLMAAGDREGLCRAAHQLKGSAGGYGFGDLCLYAGRVEALCRDRRTTGDQLETAVDELSQQASRVRAK
ncbi:Hpt domain-containing protein [Aeoliella sp. ICT_H6.2]|uniref:Hpt domain-containing protein n=1 Tax=Aeoliella straminimaris TaxID=2954799 RepID=A0A9X2FDX5_9BACT|nr:Hpt domain-containing protein [Aeoliella straminimaris]MCO6042451.1 Hpt domain-containing protein [Aeoliella straminimaris]